MDEILSSTAAAILQFPNNSLHLWKHKTNATRQNSPQLASKQQFQWTLLVSTQAIKALHHTPKDQILSSGKGGQSEGFFLDYCDSQCVPIKFTMGSQQYSPGT
jgi:hypothetical protein